jgi:hypothetical protein
MRYAVPIIPYFVNYYQEYLYWIGEPVKPCT